MDSWEHQCQADVNRPSIHDPKGRKQLIYRMKKKKIYQRKKNMNLSLTRVKEIIPARSVKSMSEEIVQNIFLSLKNFKKSRKLSFAILEKKMRGWLTN